MSSRAQGNAAAIRQILIDQAGHADLYRTATAGPSGQRTDIHVGRVRYTWKGPYEVQVIDMRDGHAGTVVGYAAREACMTGRWLTYAEDHDGTIRLIGYASALSVGVDALVHGVHAATGRHDSHRISGSFTPFR